MRRAVITGMGAVTPLGIGVEEFWQRLTAGERGLRPLTLFDPTGLRNDLVGEVSGWRFDPVEFGLSHEPDRATQFLLHASREALRAADQEGPDTVEATRGAILSSNFGGAEAWEEFAHSLREPPVEAEMLTEFDFAAAAHYLGQVVSLSGPVMTLSVACASGSAAIGIAADLVRSGAAESMLAGGHDCLAPSHLAGLSVLHTITSEDIRPFSKNRSGTLFGEGAAMVLVEELEHARARGAEPLAEVLGSWQNNNAFHITAPDEGGAGMARCLTRALEEAGLPPSEVDYINAHGTGTEHHDPAETEAIKAVLGSHAHEIGVSSIKGAIGHLMGAAGAIEVVATVLALRDGMLPPTMNLDEPDPACDLDYVPDVSRRQDITYAVSISAGIGGSNAVVVLGQVPSEAGAA
ncbi:MAG: beta-ketoacyl-[acyl-carrier-protein] synthase family protein [candidate division WS1 bacterium]|nr:beta-ketoacyl-[acyl-carrier-protein] synthase family protein [candidate division WS1 bacterium]